MSYGALERILLQLGFERVATKGPQVVYRHPESDSLVMLPPGEPTDMLDEIHTVTVRRFLVERGLVEDADAFDELSGAAAQPR
jgi:predicted RNA binding protein YcfA (HicA-like mRNA interferase family)